MPQNKVNTFQPIGKPGMLADGYQVPSCMAWVMASNGTAKPAMGLAYTIKTVSGLDTVPPDPAQRVAMPGGTNPFVGILVYGNSYVNTTDFESTDVLPEGSEGDLCTHGHIWVAIEGSATIGQEVEFNQTTGALKAPAVAGTADSGYTIIPNAKFIYVNDGGTDGELALIELV